jgi:hypothetical protein
MPISGLPVPDPVWRLPGCRGTVDLAGISYPAAGFTAGVAVGEVAGQIAKELGASERVGRIVRQTTHVVVSTGVQWTVNAAMVDPVGAAAAPAAAGAGAVVHQAAVEAFASGQGAAPVQST